MIPGSPHEGWSVSYVTSAGTQVLRINTNSGRNAFASGTLWDASSVRYACATFDRRLVWEGANAEVRVTHDVRFNVGDRFVMFTTTIVALQPITDVRFARFIDPDVDFNVHGNFNTLNTLGAPAAGIPASDIRSPWGPTAARSSCCTRRMWPPT